MKNIKIRALCEGAVMVALSTALGFLKFFELPQGGAVGIGMLPIFIFCLRWGPKESFLCSFACGILQLLLDGAYAWGPTSMLFDYILAYGVLGIASLFRNMKGGVIIGPVVATLCRTLMHFISGVTIYRIYGPTEILNKVYANPYVYSAVYNGSYMLIDLVICLIIIGVIYKPLKPILKGEDLKN